MSMVKINPLILHKLEERDIPPHVKGFLREILQHEKGGLDQERPHYTTAYNNLLNKYILQSNNPDASE